MNASNYEGANGQGVPAEREAPSPVEQSRKRQEGGNVEESPEVESEMGNPTPGQNEGTEERGTQIPPRPVALPVLFDNIPGKLRALDQWVGWRFQWDEKCVKYSKAPVQPGGHYARVNAPSTWNSFAAVMAAYRKGSFDGIGIVLTEEDDVVGVDLDRQAGKFGRLSDLAVSALESFDTYSEKSPSGNGVRLFCTGTMEAKGHNNRKGIEIYRAAHFLTVTGQRIEGTKATLEPAQDAIDAFVALHFPKSVSSPPPSPYQAQTQEGEEPDSPAPRLKLRPEQIVPRARAAKNGHKFRALYDFGDLSDYEGDESAADMGLCRLLAFWTGGRPDIIDQLMRESALLRTPERVAKWERPCSGGLSYGQYTIKRAVESCTHFFGEPLPAPVSESDLPTTPGFSADDIGNGERFAAQHLGRARFCPPWKGWLVYDREEGRWVRDECRQVEALAKLTARSIEREAAGIADLHSRSEMQRFAKASTTRQKREKMLEDAQSEKGMIILPDQLDRDPFLLNVLNGSVDLTTGLLRPHDPDDLISRVAPVQFDPHAKCPIFEAFLEAVFEGKREMIDFVQVAFGLALTGDVSEQTNVFLVGSGSNGKSTLTQTIARILGSYAHESPPETFMEQKSEKIATDIADLLGVRFALTSESRRGQKLDEAKFKRGCGGERITGERKFEHPFSFYPQYKLFFVTNHLPKIQGGEHAVWRRIAPIEFKARFWNPDKGESGPPHLRADKTMLARLGAESPGILNWLIEGCLKWRSGGLPYPEEVKAKLAAYRAEQDELHAFLEECCIFEERAVTPSRSLYYAFERWCLQNEREALSEAEFGYKLSEHGCVSDRGKGKQRNQRVRIGIALKDEFGEGNNPLRGMMDDFLGRGAGNRSLYENVFLDGQPSGLPPGI